MLYAICDRVFWTISHGDQAVILHDTSARIDIDMIKTSKTSSAAATHSTTSSYGHKLFHFIFIPLMPMSESLTLFWLIHCNLANNGI